MSYQIEVTRQYLKDLKLARKRNLDESKLNDIGRFAFLSAARSARASTRTIHNGMHDLVAVSPNT